MTESDENFGRVMSLLHQLPEKEYALYRLGRSLHGSFEMADIHRTAADREYVAEVAKRIREVLSDEGREQFARWLEPGGVLRYGQASRSDDP
jgi:hypothetical protein